MQYEDYYSVLGVSRSASQDELQSAFRKKARQYHPDVSKEPDAEEQFKKINEAYEVLKDPKTRERYDALGADWKAGQNFRPPPGWGGQGFGGGQQVNIEDLFGHQAGGFSDFFKSFMGGQAQGFGPRGGPQARRTQRARPARGADREERARVTLEQLHEGATLKVDVRRPEGPKSYRVKIPAGSLDGSVIRLAGQGEPGAHGGEAGDLRVRLELEAHPIFDPRGYDLDAAVALTPWEAALGAKIEVPTLTGPVTLKVPAGVVGGTRMRLKGKGLPGRGRGEVGDLYVRLDIVNPPELSEPQRALYEQLAQLSDFNPRQSS